MEKEKLEELIEKGYSQRKIAEEFNCSQSRIKYWLKKFDLKTKNNPHNKGKNLNKSERFCPRCNKDKPISEFYIRTNRNDVTGYCKKCSNKYHIDRVKKVKTRMIEYKGGKCVDCNLKLEDSHRNVFEFHHLNPSEKDINFHLIKFQKWGVIKKELDKCVLLCANCHRIRHVIE